jgi:tRNA(Ile)-lysidine synthase
MARSRPFIDEPLIDLPAPPRLGRAGRYWLAYSGGVDSTFLLHALKHLPRLTAVHVHHGLQRAADGWARRCRAECARQRVAFRQLRVRIDPRDPSGPEAAARTARYAALRALMRSGDLLITAHHLDDQAETVLLRLLRGTGVDGLAAMRALVDFAPGRLWRPLLGVPRERIVASARAVRLAWVEDPHNADPRYARSRLRGEVLPVLERFAPGAVERLARLAEHAAEASEVLAEVARRDLGQLGVDGGLSVGGLLELSPARRHNALRAWLARGGLAAPDARALGRIDAEVLGARADAAPRLRLGAHELRRYRDRLFLMPVLDEFPHGFEKRWSGRRTLTLPAGAGRLSLAGAHAALRLTVRVLRGGERLKPACGGPTRTLKNLFQEAGVPPWVRQRTPLLYENGALRCAGDAWCDADWASRGLVLNWDTDLPGRTTRGA